MEESKEFQKYWELSRKSDNGEKLSKEYTDELIDLYNKYSDPRNKCTAAILLSFITDDNKVPPVLFDALNYWNDSGYSGWISTSNARLFNNYPNYRDKYLDLMFKGNFSQRYILAESLLFFKDDLKGFTKSDIDKILDDFLAKEKDEKLKNFIHFKMHLKEKVEFMEKFLIDLDPLGLIKKNRNKSVYQVAAASMLGFYEDKGQAIEKIKKVFDLEFKMVPDEKILDRIAQKLILIK